MILSAAAIAAGFALLIWAADRFVAGAASLAKQMGVSPLLVGLTVVGLGTSAPEMVVAAVASLQNQPALAVGNALGSNITNIALILGATALVMPLTVGRGIIRRELPILAVISLGTFALCLDGALTRLDGAALLMGLLVLLGWMASQARNSGDLADTIDVPGDMSRRRAWLWLGCGLILLPLGSQLAVWGAVNIATALGISELVIGLTIIAIGTSLPELAASLAGALKGHPDIALGNVIGSNMFNLLVVLAMPALIAPGLLPAEVISRDFPIMLAATALLFVLGYGIRGRGRINRIEGAALLTGFVAYEFVLFTYG